MSATQPTPTPRRPRTRGPGRAAALAAVVALGLVVAACGGGGSAREQAIGALTEGTWTCTGNDGKVATTISVDDDGSFTLGAGDDDPDDRQEGTWDVVGKKVSLQVSTDDDKSVLEVRGFDDLDVKVGTIEVKNPDDPDETASLRVDLRSKDEVTITPTEDPRSFPTAPWSCARS